MIRKGFDLDPDAMLDVLLDKLLRLRNAILQPSTSRRLEILFAQML
jgi:hypothetical protein